MILVIVTSLRHFLGWTVSTFSSRQNLILENLALRQQLLALHVDHTHPAASEFLDNAVVRNCLVDHWRKILRARRDQVNESRGDY